MAAEPSRQPVPLAPPRGFLHGWHIAVDVSFRSGALEDTARLAASTADLALRWGDLATTIKVRLLGALVNVGTGRPDLIEGEARAALALIDGLAPPDPTVESAVTTAGDGSMPPDALPPHVRFWRAHALALLARAAVTRGQVLVAMDYLADAIAAIEDTEPRTTDDAAAILVLANSLSSVVLLEPAIALAGRALALTDRLARRAADPYVLGIRTALARRQAEASSLIAGTRSLETSSGRATASYAAAASRALRHRRAAADSQEPGELDAARVFLAFAELGLRGPTDTGPLPMAEEAAVQQAVDRMNGDVITVGPARGGAPLGRIVLARLRAGRGRREAARAVLEDGVPTRVLEQGGGSPWWSLLGIARAQIEEDDGHPAVAFWRELALAASLRQWHERDARFADLRHRVAKRQLRWRRAATEGELLRDPLTGLGNRRRMEIELDRAISSVLFLDLDRFKLINDELGHEVGDAVLRRVADILRACCRAPDVVIRYGGDEFVVILDRGSDAAALGARVIEGVRQEDWSALTGRLPVTVSIGAAAAPTLRDALRRSDTAMLAAKQAGRDGLSLAPTPAVPVRSEAVPSEPWRPDRDGADAPPAGRPRSGALARVDEPGALSPLLEGAARRYARGDWTTAGHAIEELQRLAELFGDRATGRDARLLGLRLRLERANWPGLLEAAQTFLDDGEDLPGPARALALGLLASARQQDGRTAEALAAAAEGYELVKTGSGWATQRALACFSLSTPLFAALLFDPGLELLSLGEGLARRGIAQPWAGVSPGRFAAGRARAEVVRGQLVELMGDRSSADVHFRAAAEHAVRALRDCAPEGVLRLRAEAALAIALQRLGVAQVDRQVLVRHVAREPFPRVALLSRLALGTFDAECGDLVPARALISSVLVDAERLGDVVLGYVATARAAQVEEAARGRTDASREWRRLAERQLGRLWADRVGRFEALVSARQVEALSVVVASERSRLWEDALTAVGNRRLLDRLLADPAMAARPTAFIDVDWFKQINDRFGHAVGDEVLRRVAALLVAVSRSGDVVVRYGGDEFVVVLDEGSDIEGFCERVRRGVADHAWDALRPGLAVTVSVGGVQGGPRSMSRADAALLRAKNARAVPADLSARAGDRTARV